ncbi:tRNA uridine-5-carboxymethylaminomethyl(34) synthesis GTPase MnmE [Prochlorococcus marinus]|uniref:tRNA modification GTPase MnmE n=1 Tax=Prochlorococcus marinus (strain MIT 9211) TaxID=93059 RepID=A9BDF2_PROM4|nr:tRNA uridine-5-carboxymethylaminomethyl(34) synthesis GTPase MnmE [Prochlorococcus marinus]ABX08138.1 putative thiophen / furan oxidation protein [Prochlorococcus marinus str. MIT 9211]
MNLAFSTEETIAAIASAVSPGQGGVAVIRISGRSAQETCKQIVHIPGDQIWSSHRIVYGHVIEKKTQKHIDEVLILIMEAPRSFTGEDVVEIHCHGGLISVQRILNQILEQPDVRRALPGEFSQRAVLNGRLDLIQAEAINDLISAKSQKAAELAMAGVDGDITQRINSLRDKLLDQLSEIEARIDFEDDLPPLNKQALLADLIKINNELQQLVIDAKQGCIFRNGLKIALIGLPNVGKSSVLNRLSKRERAIVTALPGTTRDLLESEIILEGIPITLLDTAGIRSTNDEVEKIGVAKSKNALMTADIVLFIFDMSIGWTTADQDLFDQIPKQMPTLLIGNKADIKVQQDTNQAEIIFSALTGQGENNLIQALLKICGLHETHGIEIALNERQLDLVNAASKALGKTLEVTTQELPWDFWTIDLRDAIQKLGELTGHEISEALLDRIFSRFCIGK